MFTSVIIAAGMYSASLSVFAFEGDSRLCVLLGYGGFGVLALGAFLSL
jgi:hypothetical protein